MLRTGWMLYPLFLLAVLILSACQPVMPVEAGTPVDTEPAKSESETITPTWDEIFVINRFTSADIDIYEEFVCDIGANCTKIPGGLYMGDSPRGYSDEVPQLTIISQLDRDYNEVILHLRRAGSETTSISVDGGEPLLVTSEMLGSRDGGLYGAYELPLGPLQSGSHSITFAIPDDSPGNSGILGVHCR